MKKKHPEKRIRTDEEMSRAADAKLKRYITKSALDWAEKEPEVRRQMVAQTLGYKIPSETEKNEIRLVTLIDDLAIKMLKEDPKLARKMAEARLRRLTEEMGLKIEGEEWLRKPRTLDDMIEDVKKYKFLEEAFGVKEPGFLDSILDPKVIAAFLKLASELFGNKQAPPAHTKMILVNKDGEEREIPWQDYEQLKAGGNIGNPKDVETGEPISPDSGSDTASESETLNRTDEGDGETSGASSGS